MRRRRRGRRIGKAWAGTRTSLVRCAVRRERMDALKRFKVRCRTARVGRRQFNFHLSHLLRSHTLGQPGDPRILSVSSCSTIHRQHRTAGSCRSLKPPHRSPHQPSRPLRALNAVGRAMGAPANSRKGICTDSLSPIDSPSLKPTPPPHRSPLLASTPLQPHKASRPCPSKRP
jgi:hypothetical protein